MNPRAFLLFSALLLTPVLLPAAEPPQPAAHRPKIGLVLGGGGALGMAHVGVLKVLEEQRIPIDCIAGTSMGSIIGGLYASGMSPEEIKTFLESLDWNEVMSDDTPRREMFFRRKGEDQRYLFELGFKDGGFRVGTGMAAGQKFNNIMQFITLRTMGTTDFDRLPIPFRAVATDLRSGEPFVIKAGNLPTAMRASMAVPGAFTPVEIDGHLLVDGGIVDNLPVDVVKTMGAEFIIAVDVGSDADKVSDETLKSLAGILGRTYAIAQRPEQMSMYKLADIGIQPNLEGFTATQFDRAAKIIPAGEKAALEKIPQLSKLGVSPEEYARFLAGHRRKNPDRLSLRSVSVTGNQRVAHDLIQGRIRLQPGDVFEQRRVEGDLKRIYGLDEFEQVMARFEPAGADACDLAYDVSEKSWGPLYFKFGLQLTSDSKENSDWRMLVNFTRMSLNSLGAEWRNELQVGSTQDLLSEFYQPLDSRGFLFLAPNVEYKSDLQDVYLAGRNIANYEVNRTTGRFDVGVQLRHFAEFRAGPYWGHGSAGVETGAAELPELDENLAGWTTSLTVDRQDRTLFARSGYFCKAQGKVATEDMGGERDYEKFALEYKGFQTFDDHTFSLGLQMGTSPDKDLPAYDQYTLGGAFSFAGLAEDQFRGQNLGVASLGYRYRLMTLPPTLGQAVYAMTRLDVGNVWRDDIETGDLRQGVAIGAGADTKLGPLYLAYGHAEGGYDRYYFSLGAAF
ncbi:MAG: patatin-like phospholipase family protein [Kiritimatiellia bacterium]